MNTPAAASSNSAYRGKIKFYHLFYLLLLFGFKRQHHFCYLSRIDSSEDRPWILMVAMADKLTEILEDLSVLQFV